MGDYDLFLTPAMECVAFEHGRTGLLVPPADPAALTAAVRRLISDRELRSRLGEAGAARVRVKFDVGQMVDQVTASYTVEQV